MTPRIICPHCHCAIDPLTLEAAVSAQAQYRICPECDGPIALFVASEDDRDAAAAPALEAVPGERARSHAAINIY